MSKNTASNRFRKVNVDDYDEDKFQEDNTEDTVQGPNEGEVNQLLQTNKNLEALNLVLSNPPVGTKNQAVKDRALQNVMRVLMAFKTSEVAGAVKSLDDPTIDVLMKYIYRGFEIPSDNSSAVLLAWHEKAFEQGGLGSIVRTLTDRKRV